MHRSVVTARTTAVVIISMNTGPKLSFQKLLILGQNGNLDKWDFHFGTKWKSLETAREITVNRDMGSVHTIQT